MQVLLTFDIEIWCNGWDNLDEAFPAAFERYVYGQSRHGQYALPKTLETLKNHGLHGVFFVEPLFSARFGIQYLETIVSMIQEAGQEVQLHLHPEWTDEISPPIIQDASRKRQHLNLYTLEEQTQLIGHGLALLHEAGVGDVTAFRAGGFAANRDTYRALAANGIWLDSSIDAVLPDSIPDFRDTIDPYQALRLDGVGVYPMTVFQDGLNRDRHAQISASSDAELIQAMRMAKALGHDYFMTLSHNFELLKPASHQPDWIVAKRFERLCRFLSDHRGEFDTAGFASCPPIREAHPRPLAKVGPLPTFRRLLEQAYRRL